MEKLGLTEKDSFSISGLTGREYSLMPSTRCLFGVILISCFGGVIFNSLWLRFQRGNILVPSNIEMFILKQHVLAVEHAQLNSDNRPLPKFICYGISVEKYPV